MRSADIIPIIRNFLIRPYVVFIPVILNSDIWEVRWGRRVGMEETSIACLV